MHKNTLVLHYSSRSVSIFFFLVDFSSCRLMCRCPIVVFIDFCRCFLVNPSVRPVHVLRKPRVIALRRLVVVGLNSAAWKYMLHLWFGFLGQNIIYHKFFLIQGNFPHSFFLFLVPFNICCLFFGLSFLVGIV